MIFTSKNKVFSVGSPANGLVDEIHGALQSQRMITPEHTGFALATESLRDPQRDMLESSAQQLRVALEGITGRLFPNQPPTQYQLDAAVAAGILAGDPVKFLRTPLKAPTADEMTSVVTMNIGMEDAGMERIRPALEAYDERENRQAATYSITYNMKSAQQDEFGEAFFPTIVVPPDNAGFIISVHLMMVYNEIQRNVSGAWDNYNKKNIIRAIADPTILKNDLTKIVPVNRAQSVDKFVDPAVIAPYAIDLEGTSINTAPLACGKELSLLGISQTDALLANGTQDMTDSIDPTVSLSAIYVQVAGVGGQAGTNDVFKFKVDGLPFVNFTAMHQQNYRQMNLNFDSTSLLLTPATKNLDGSNPVILASVATNTLTVRLKVKMSGEINIETADTVVFGNMIEILQVQNAAGDTVPLNQAPAAALVTAFATAKIIGYDLTAWRTNINRRQRGQLIDRTEVRQAYNVPLRGPITAIHPVTSDTTTDASDLDALITGTRIRTSNQAVEALLNVDRLLAEYKPAPDAAGVGPDVMGIGRFYVKPTYFYDAISMVDIVNNMSSKNWAEDVQQALVTQIRYYAYQMYRNSQYKAAADALMGGQAPIPRVIIGTDPVIAQYLMVTGDLRTLGNEFDVTVVSTLNENMTGKLFITFGVFDESRNNAVNPLNFGNMAWSPELTVVLPISRNNTISRELTVQPRFIHINHLPVLTRLDISGIPDVLNKIPLNVHNWVQP
jgi:hypothetical protein